MTIWYRYNTENQVVSRSQIEEELQVSIGERSQFLLYRKIEG